MSDVDIVPDGAEVTPLMIAAALRVWDRAPEMQPIEDVLAAVYRAMRVARPLAEGPK
jgi:hypothetical protein